MKVKNIFKIIIIFLVLTVLISFSYSSMAFNEDYGNPKQFEDPSYNKWENIGGLHVKKFSKSLIGRILTILRIIVMAWAIIMLLLIGIKYMTSAPQIKAQLKMDIPTYVIGAILLFGAAGVMKLIEYFADATVGT
jgi:hypothetical protein